jgi:hypothetical protein
LRIQLQILSRVPPTATVTYNPFPAGNRGSKQDRRVTLYDFQGNLEFAPVLSGIFALWGKPKIDNTYFNGFSQQNAMRAEY